MQAQGPDGQTQTMLGLADARQISSKMVATSPAFQTVLPKMDGSRTIDEICGEIGQGLQAETMQSFVAQLDDAGLLEGPTFQALLGELRAQFESAPDLPPGKTAEVADALVVGEVGESATDEQKAELGPAALQRALDQWMNKALEDAENPSFDALPKAIVVPQSDYARAWPAYAHAWGRLRVADRPDRVLVLGSNTFGEATGVTACDKGFRSPLGLCPLDSGLLEAIKGQLGDQGAEALLRNRFDHEREHSIELQIPWIQHCLGRDEAAPEGEGYVPMLGVLVHDPVANNGESYDGTGVSLTAFVDAVRGALEQLGGSTLIVASADLAHVGPAFGDQVQLVGDSEQATQARQQLVASDQANLKQYAEQSAMDLVTAMAWQQNPTRWNALGAMAAAKMIAEPERVDPLHYMAAMDPQGMGVVSTAAMAMF
ncbi:MAG: AmmeMemoRadiSam system protein B [Planctomycetota bacterium]